MAVQVSKLLLHNHSLEGQLGKQQALAELREFPTLV